MANIMKAHWIKSETLMKLIKNKLNQSLGME